MIDLHCHLLPGIDDGPDSISRSIDLANAAVSNGTQTIIATPHVSGRYPNRAEPIAQLVAQVQDRLDQEGIAIQIRPGAEIAMTSVFELEPGELLSLGLGGSRWLLVEPPFATIASGLPRIISELHGLGHQVVLAHPERCPAFHRDRQMLSSLARSGVLMSITAGSLGGHFGATVRRFALELVREGLIDNIASDAHDHIHRPPSIAAEIEQAGLGPLAEWLTELVPAAILSGGEVPPRPPVDLSRRRVGWRARWWRSG